MTATRDATVAKLVLEHEADLRDLAETDLQCAKYARELLALADENRGVH